jgi:FMN phosphatase YigB (HAD superfamily)
MIRHASAPITTVLFDLGGVLSNDIWEHVLFDHHNGLAPRGWLARRRWRRAAQAAWDQVSTKPDVTEEDFWHSFEAAVGVQITKAAIQASEHRVIRANPEGHRLIAALKAAGLRVGIVSNNSAFWYPRQMAALGHPKIDPELIFLSNQTGRTKLTGLYALAAEHIDPRTTLVIEDRPPFRKRARAAGFHVAGYNLTSGRSLAALLHRHGLLKAPRGS